jgi:hypothetical protein
MNIILLLINELKNKHTRLTQTFFFLIQNRLFRKMGLMRGGKNKEKYKKSGLNEKI